MIKSKLISIDKLSEWFGGSATVRYNEKLLEYRIIIRNDDLINEFVFWFTDMHVLKYGEKELVRYMLEKYIRQMESEQQLLRKGLIENDKGRTYQRLCS